MDFLQKPHVHLDGADIIVETLVPYILKSKQMLKRTITYTTIELMYSLSSWHGLAFIAMDVLKTKHHFF